MFTLRWIQAIAIFSFTVICFPCFGQASNAGYDRMDGDFIKPSKRAQPRRNFNLESQERVSSSTSQRTGVPRSANFGVASGRDREDDRQESRSAKDRSPDDRFRQPENEGRIEPYPTEDDSASGEAVGGSEGYETTEASEVAEESATPAEPKLPINENQLVFCSKKLLEFHWDMDCRMLKNVKPTRLTYKMAREGRYTECTYCGWK